MNSLTQIRVPQATGSDFFQFDVSDRIIDSDWDTLLQDANDGHHVQSSRWANVKSLNGWKAKRILVRQHDRVVGGAQLLVRRTRFLGAVGYVPKGPVLTVDDVEVADSLLDRLQQIAISEKLRVLFVQPSAAGVLEHRLATRGFCPCPVETAPSSTILLDLSAPLDTILGRMPKGMRNQVRRSQNRGITVRLGTREDLPTFHQLLTATSQRRKFSTFELEYFQGMWDILEPAGNIKLFIAELDREAVSAQFCIPFGDTVTAKQIGWSGKHRRLHPNEALDWFTIQWCKENGYKYYDLEGIEPPAAQAIINDRPLPNEFMGTPTAYKLRLGGDVKIYPGAYCYLANPLLRTLYNRVGCQVANWSIFQKAIGRFRTG